MSVGSMLDLVNATSKTTDDFASSIASVEPLIDRFAEALIGWNLEDEHGQPVPADAEGVRRQDLGFIVPVVMRWMSAIADVAPPLPAASSSGPPAPEASLQLGNSSASQPSS